MNHLRGLAISICWLDESRVPCLDLVKEYVDISTF